MANCVADVAVRVRPLSPGDSLARAAEAVRTAPGGIVPVHAAGEIIGIVSAAGLADWIAEAGPEAASRATVQEVARSAPEAFYHDTLIRRALEQLRTREDAASPVVDRFGRYLGMVGCGELLSAQMGALRPPLIGGMATPFGVYLTDGTRRAGVGDRALISAGIFLGTLLMLSSWLAYRASVTTMALLEHIAPHLSRSLAGDLPPAMPPAALYAALSLLLYAVLFRVSWITGYHAAEHQVVHAIEQGDDLRPEVVKEKPRIHPRCGTNLMAAFGMFMVLDRWAGSLAFIGALFAWRFFGPLLQQHITTRPARGWELESGLRAGRQLLERYQSGVGRDSSGWRRLWNMGLLQVGVGFAVVWGLIFLGHGLLRPGSLEATWFNNYLGS